KQEPREQTQINPSRSGNLAHASIIASMCMLFLVAVPRVAAAYFDALGHDVGLVPKVALPLLSDCESMPFPTEALRPAKDGSDEDSAASLRFHCAGEFFFVSLHRYPPRIGVRLLF